MLARTLPFAVLSGPVCGDRPSDDQTRERAGCSRRKGRNGHEVTGRMTAGGHEHSAAHASLDAAKRSRRPLHPLGKATLMGHAEPRRSRSWCRLS